MNMFTLFGEVNRVIIEFMAVISLSGTPQVKHELTVENLASELQRQRVEHWEVVLSQAILESGWDLNSHICQKSNNFIGMRIPGKRPSARVGTYRGYSLYRSWKDCVRDIRLWQVYNWEDGSRADYMHTLQRRWAESPQYHSGLNLILRKLSRQGIIKDYYKK